MYSPQLGRWLSPDPLTRDPTLFYDNNALGDWLTVMKNQYVYCGNNPINKVDPSGLSVAGRIFSDCCAPKCAPNEGWEFLALGCLTAAAINGTQARNQGQAAADQYFPGVNSVQNRAMRHCVASGVLATLSGCQMAECIGTARENAQHDEDNQSQRETERGINNNRLGRQCGGCSGPDRTQEREVRSVDQIINCCKFWVQNGGGDQGP
jgi:RHS repeat-associated protein